MGKGETEIIKEALEENVQALIDDKKARIIGEVKKIAIELYQEGNSLELAAEKAHVNLWDLVESLHKRSISTRFDIDEEKLLFSESLKDEFPALAQKILKM